MIRQHLLLGAGLLLVLVFAAFFLAWPRYRIDQNTFQEVQIGMTEREVEVVFGGPAHFQESWEAFIPGVGHREGFNKQWCGKELAAEVSFSDGRVWIIRRLLPFEKPRNWFWKLRPWFGL